jgi:hypothetical protein
MLKGKKSSSDAYSEKLIPTRVTITRQRGNLTYVFEIDGFRGEHTGQIHYKGSEIERVEHFLKSNNVIYAFTVSTKGLVSYLEIPQIVTSSSQPTGNLTGLEDIFRLQPRTQQIRVPQWD